MVTSPEGIAYHECFKRYCGCYDTEVCKDFKTWWSIEAAGTCTAEATAATACVTPECVADKASLVTNADKIVGCEALDVGLNRCFTEVCTTSSYNPTSPEYIAWATCKWTACGCAGSTPVITLAECPTKKTMAELDTACATENTAFEACTDTDCAADKAIMADDADFLIKTLACATDNAADSCK